MDNSNHWYTLPNETRHKCIQCNGSFAARLYSGRTRLCIHCQANFDLGLISDPNPHANHVAQNTRYCYDCGHLVNNNAREWNVESGRCRGCATDHIEQQAHRRAFAVLDNETRVQVTIPERRTCEIHTQCKSCRKRQKCTRCGIIKKKKYFRKAADTAGASSAPESFSTRCEVCRQTESDLIGRRRDAAEAAGHRYCAQGRHEVSLRECTAPDGTVYLTCQKCLISRRDARASTARTGEAAADRDAEDHGEGLNPDEDDEGVQAGPVDEYDAFFGDGLDLAGIDLPGDSAVSLDQAECIKNMDRALDALAIEKCGCCREEGFDVKLKGPGLCTRCFNDKRDTRLWSDGNKVNPMPEDLRPGCVRNLTDMEEMLIARVKPIMQVRWTRGHQLCYKDHIVNLPQDISPIAQTLPRLPENIDMVIIRQDGVNLDGHVDFITDPRRSYSNLSGGGTSWGTIGHAHGSN
ncbi:hypothetical protein MVEN_00040400 [Mycena venus]|uniref:DUF6570 domain-containing protein n=1 Tax=Mycena venus TaxID=2733690 RepID=A0A8H6Z7M9_9AGAR|nr:hypothetical protein MVEN_00040400 [Mycena venus]